MFRPLLFISLLLISALPAEAQGRRLATPICAVVRTALNCYDGRGVPRTISDQGEQVADVDIAPDGQWVVYRGYTQDTANIRIAPLFDGGSTEIGTQATLPAELRDDWVTLAWSPDGLTIAYIVANGLRAVFPTLAGTPRTVEFTDRQYVDVRFSPTGARLAARSGDGSWTLFEVIERYTDTASLRPQRALNLSADLTWQTDGSAVIAPEAGGLYRLNASDPTAQYELITPTGVFSRLVTLPDGTIRALSADPARGVSSVISVAADGTLAPVGDRQVDPRVRWVRQGRRLLYITSGTPIVIDPTTGEENTLPLQSVERIAWSPIAIESIATYGLDADLFYLAPDPDGVRQVWRLSRTGNQPAQQLTSLPTGVAGYAVSPSRAWLAVVNDRQLTLFRFSESGLAAATSTPRPFSGTPTAGPAQPLATLQRREAVTLTWSPDSSQIAFADEGGVFTVTADGSSAPQQVLINTPDQRHDRPVFSPDGSYLLARHASSTQVGYSVVLLRGAPGSFLIPALQPNGVDRVQWAAGNLNRLGLLLTQQSSGSTISLITLDGQQPLVQFPAPIIDAGYIQNVTAPALLFLSRVGWLHGPDVVQLYAVSGAGTAQISGPPLVLNAPVMSPTGRLAYSVQRIDDDRQTNQIIIADLQNGTKIAIDVAHNVSSVQWVF